jgi:hypothetical protein
MKIGPGEYLQFKIEQHVTQLYKDFLYILEDLQDQEKITPEDFAFYRKRVLDLGNNKMRELARELENFNIS